MTFDSTPTIAAAWEARLQAEPGATALIHEGRTWSRAELDTYRAACRRELHRVGVRPGDRVVLMLDNGPGFLAAFLACQSLGAIAVPVSPKSSVERMDYLVEDCCASLLLIGPELSPRTLEPHLCRDYAGLFLTLPAHGSGSGFDKDPPFHATAEECALIQYTSGSTSASKGVMISNRAVLANISGFAAEMGLAPGHDVFSSLMPLFHDMGLICFGLAPLLLGYPLVLYRQESLSLYDWLEGIGRQRVTITGAPDSLLYIANRVVEKPADFPLETLRMLICGSEPVRAATVRIFGERFGVTGAIKPAYGMAELTLCATITPVDEAMRIDAADRVSSGRPIEGVEIKIRDERGATTRAPGVSGEILVRSPALMSGYFRRTPESAALMDSEGYLATGDSGHLDEDGWLYVVGRIKNLLIRGGEKYSPHDLETIALGQPIVRRAAAVQLGNGSGRIVAVLEIDRLALKNPEVMGELGRGYLRMVHQRVGLAPDEVWFVKGGVLPTTENGKMRHALLRSMMEEGRLRAVAIWPPQAVSKTSGEPHAVDAL